ncbi:MAG: isoprenoid biosynthesis glyoxalase ElbB [Pseudomonadota bacterium]
MIFLFRGHLDGAEIRESVLTLLFLDKYDVSYSIFAPNIEQHHVINHLNGEEESQDTRNVLTESARIARGEISELSKLDMTMFDALIIPGGFGVAKNLSNFAFHNVDGEVNSLFTNIILNTIDQKKPIGAICITPAILTLALKDKLTNLHVTIGDDADNIIEKMNAKHSICQSDEIVVDQQNQIVTCSAYMRNDSIYKISVGIEKLVQQIIDMC